MPAGGKEIPYVETAPEPALTDAEKQRGYLLFARPTVEPIYPNTRPRPDERLEALVAFAAPGQFEPVTLALYPVRPLVNLKVRVSPLACPAGEIPADRIDVRLGTYWNVGYPQYTTVKTYRRTPELLERVTVHSSPAGECQRYWLTIHVPDDAKPGLYRGTVTIWDDGFDRALEHPDRSAGPGLPPPERPGQALLGLFLHEEQDPLPRAERGVHSQGRRQRLPGHGRLRPGHAADALPELRGRQADRRARRRRNPADAPRRSAGPGAGDGRRRHPAASIATPRPAERSRTTGGSARMPPPAFYDRITELFRALEVERKAKGWPEFICCPIDEVDPSCKEFGVKVYAAVKAAGVRTYATKDPVEPDAAAYAPYLDIWCSQPYSVPFERIVAQKRYEYWCYPNHNAGEIKDRLTMCKGGRMTYGFGFWRSGYTTLIPWHWCWTCAPDPFDYLRGGHSGCGQRMDDEGEVIPAVYWACFREGYDDARYRLHAPAGDRPAARFHRSGLPGGGSPRGGRVLQETWDAIRVQPKYLAAGMWPSEEFDAIRWRLAAQTERLLQYPATNKAIAPSVLIDADGRAARPRRRPLRRSSRRPRRGNSKPSTSAAASAPGPTAPPRARSRSPSRRGTRARRDSAGRSRSIGSTTAAKAASTPSAGRGSAAVSSPANST